MATHIGPETLLLEELELLLELLDDEELELDDDELLLLLELLLELLDDEELQQHLSCIAKSPSTNRKSPSTK